MLLRASGEHDGEDYRLEALTGSGDGGVPHGAVLAAFAEAVLGEDAPRLAESRETLRRALGEAALVDTAAVVATFNGVDRVADATGTPLEEAKAEATTGMRARLGIDGFGLAE